MTLPWIIAGAVAGLLAGPRVRAVVFAGSTSAEQSPRRECPDCSGEILPGRGRWRSVLPATGRCPVCHAQIAQPLLAELAAGGALAIVAARASSGWEFAALAWLALIAVPLALIDMAVHRLPDRLTGPAFAGTLALLTVAALTAHQPDRLAHAAIGAGALACFYLALYLLRPGQMGLGDVKIAASIGLVLGWTSWQALLTGTFAGFALAAVYGGVQIARHEATRATQLPLGPFILLGTVVALALLHPRWTVRRTRLRQSWPRRSRPGSEPGSEDLAADRPLDQLDRPRGRGELEARRGLPRPPKESSGASAGLTGPPGSGSSSTPGTTSSAAQIRVSDATE